LPCPLARFPERFLVFRRQRFVVIRRGESRRTARFRPSWFPLLAKAAGSGAPHLSIYFFTFNLFLTQSAVI